MFPAAILIVPDLQHHPPPRPAQPEARARARLLHDAVPFCVWMLKGYFDTIPISLEEAGRIDGLTPFGTFWRIVIPLSLPGSR